MTKEAVLEPIDERLTWEQVLDRLKERKLVEVARRTARETGVPIELLLGRGLTKSVTHARKTLYRALQEKGLSTPEIGFLLDRDHSTVVLGLQAESAQRLGMRRPRRRRTPAPEVSATTNLRPWCRQCGGARTLGPAFPLCGTCEASER